MKDVLQKALDTYGIENQTYMLFEEMAELQNAICKFRRGRATVADITTELADVYIMVLQMGMYYGMEQMQTEAAYKLQRLSERLNNQNHPVPNTSPIKINAYDCFKPV